MGARRDDEKCGGPFNAAACSRSKGPRSLVGPEAGAARRCEDAIGSAVNPPNCGAAQLNGTLLIAPVGCKSSQGLVSRRVAPCKLLARDAFSLKLHTT